MQTSASATATASTTASATTEIMGGLGNQLFQIFNLMAYSFRHRVPFYFPLEQITQGQRKNTYWTTPLLQTLQHFVKSTPSQQPLMYHERNFHYEPIPSPPQSNIKFFGYFQSYKYFQDQQELIYKFIKLRETQTAMREKTKEKYDYARTVALHFRVGDYKNLPNHHPLMSLEYYTEALKQLLKDTIDKSPNVDLHSFPHNVLYFCEEADLQYVQEKMLTPLQQNPLFKNKFTFQCIDHNLSDWEQLLVMSLCSKHIIANSTFSWWGAYLGLGGNPPTTPSPPPQTNASAKGVWACEAGGVSPHVYYPTTWFGPAMGYKNFCDFFPHHWRQINI